MAALHVAAGGKLFQMVRGWLRRRMAAVLGEAAPKPPAGRWPRARRIARATVLSLAGMGLLFSMYARLGEPF